MDNINEIFTKSQSFSLLRLEGKNVVFSLLSYQYYHLLSKQFALFHLQGTVLTLETPSNYVLLRTIYERRLRTSSPTP